METLNNQYEVRNQVSELIMLIDVAEMEDQEKIEAIDYAIKMLNELKKDI